MALTLAVMALILNALPLLALILAPMLVMTLFYQKQLAWVWHVEDAKRSGRPKISNTVRDLILATVTRNSNIREWPCWRIAQEVSSTPGFKTVSARTVYNVLNKAGYAPRKRTMKPGLNNENKKARLKWCEEHKDWTMED